MDEPRVYEIRLEGHLPTRWSDWFAGMAIHNEANGKTCLIGPLADQAALLGLLNQVHALNLTLISVNSVK